MTGSARRFIHAGATVLIAACATALIAQGRGEGADAESPSGLTAEVHLLRLSVEEFTRTQAQTQALGVYLSAQQARMVQLAARADGARKELDALTIRSKDLADRLGRVADVTRGTVDPERRAMLDQEAAVLKQETASLERQTEQARTRDAEMSQALQVEEARWTDLISRLEQIVRRPQDGRSGGRP